MGYLSAKLFVNFMVEPTVVLIQRVLKKYVIFTTLLDAATQGWNHSDVINSMGWKEVIWNPEILAKSSGLNWPGFDVNWQIFRREKYKLRCFLMVFFGSMHHIERSGYHRYTIRFAIHLYQLLFHTPAVTFFHWSFEADALIFGGELVGLFDHPPPSSPRNLRFLVGHASRWSGSDVVRVSGHQFHGFAWATFQPFGFLLLHPVRFLHVFSFERFPSMNFHPISWVSMFAPSPTVCLISWCFMMPNMCTIYLAEIGPDESNHSTKVVDLMRNFLSNCTDFWFQSWVRISSSPESTWNAFFIMFWWMPIDKEQVFGAIQWYSQIAFNCANPERVVYHNGVFLCFFCQLQEQINRI